MPSSSRKSGTTFAPASVASTAGYLATKLQQELAEVPAPKGYKTVATITVKLETHHVKKEN